MSSPGTSRTSSTRTTTRASGRRRLETRRSRSSRPVPSAPELVPIGRVGRPHGLDGSFFVEGPSEREGAFAAGATVYVAGEPVKIVASKRGSQNRPVIRLERRVDRGSELAVPREALPPPGGDEDYSFQLAGLVVEE